MLDFHVCAGGLNSGPNVCVQALYLTTPSLNIPIFFFVLYFVLFCSQILTVLPKLAWNAGIACLRQLHPGLMGMCSNDQLTNL